MAGGADSLARQAAAIRPLAPPLGSKFDGNSDAYDYFCRFTRAPVGSPDRIEVGSLPLAGNGAESRVAPGRSPRGLAPKGAL
jgi:hypothetical protein